MVWICSAGTGEPALSDGHNPALGRPGQEEGIQRIAFLRKADSLRRIGHLIRILDGIHATGDLADT